MAKDDHPKVNKSLNINALNFCRFSLAPLPPVKGKGKEEEALLAVPNLVDSELADIYHVPSMRRVYSSLNAPRQASAPRTLAPDPKGSRSGLIMSLHLRFLESRLALVMGFEDGRVELWMCSTNDGDWLGTWDGRLSEGQKWERLWEGKGHNEAGQRRSSSV